MKNKFSFGILLFFVGIIVAGFVSYSAVQETYRTRKIDKEVLALQEDAQRIQKDNDALTRKIAYLQTPEFQQRIAKDKLNMKLPDENVVVVKQSAQGGEAPKTEAIVLGDAEDNSPNYLKWWNYFFSISK
jgi:cell division protein FtsL